MNSNLLAIPLSVFMSNGNGNFGKLAFPYGKIGIESGIPAGRFIPVLLAIGESLSLKNN